MNQIYELGNGLTNLSQIHVLKLHGNRLKRLSGIEHCSSLRELHLQVLNGPCFYILFADYNTSYIYYCHSAQPNRRCPLSLFCNKTWTNLFVWKLFSRFFAVGSSTYLKVFAFVTRTYFTGMRVVLCILLTIYVHYFIYCLIDKQDNPIITDPDYKLLLLENSNLTLLDNIPVRPFVRQQVPLFRIIWRTCWWSFSNGYYYHNIPNLEIFIDFGGLFSHDILGCGYDGTTRGRGYFRGRYTRI